MARSQARSKRKVSGGRYHPARSKRGTELAGYPAMTKIDESAKLRTKRVIGGNTKNYLLTAKEINVANKGKVTKTEMVNVLENPANPNLVGRNVITKGAIVETKLGKVRITSRPGQEGSVSGVLIS